jgi:hypothetical protein
MTKKELKKKAKLWMKLNPNLINRELKMPHIIYPDICDVSCKLSNCCRQIFASPYGEIMNKKYVNVFKDFDDCFAFLDDEDIIKKCKKLRII